MGVSLTRRTQSHQLLKLVSVTDDAIDWQATYPDMEGEEAKRKRYEGDHDVASLKFLEGKTPTLFVFEHPARVDVDRKVRRSWTNLIKPNSNTDLWTDVWNDVYLGKEEGFLDAPREEPSRQGGKLTDNFLQSLLDAGVFDELGQALLNVAQQGAKSDNAATKKK